jgi:hypothetical protein
MSIEALMDDGAAFVFSWIRLGGRWGIWARCHDLIERLHLDQGLAYQATKQF